MADENDKIIKIKASIVRHIRVLNGYGYENINNLSYIKSVDKLSAYDDMLFNKILEHVGHIPAINDNGSINFNCSVCWERYKEMQGCIYVFSTCCILWITYQFIAPQ